VLSRAMAAAYARVGASGLTAALLDALDASTFEFDRTTLAELRAAGDSARRAKVRALMQPRVELTTEPRSVGNVFVACALPSDVARPQCAGDKLAMSACEFDEQVELLAADIGNPLVSGTFATSAVGVAEPTQYTPHPGETVTVRALA
jgi:hypothetical protein